MICGYGGIGSLFSRSASGGGRSEGKECATVKIMRRTAANNFGNRKSHASGCQEADRRESRNPVQQNSYMICGYGGIGRRAGFRVQCQRRAGSSPVIRTRAFTHLCEGSFLLCRGKFSQIPLVIFELNILHDFAIIDWVCCSTHHSYNRQPLDKFKK